MKGVDLSSVQSGRWLQDSTVESSNVHKKCAAQRTLDIYGIDVDWTSLKRVSESDKKPVVFAHELAGRVDVAAGAYISDRAGGDGYGQFYFYSGRCLQKYQALHCVKTIFDRDGVDKLGRDYHDVVGVTDFLKSILNGESESDLVFYNAHPERFAFSSPVDRYSNGFLIYPNFPYVDRASAQSSSRDLKDKKEGLALCAWAIHPSQGLSFLERFENFDKLSAWNAGAVNSSVVDDNSRRLSEIERGTGVKYLASILDLETADLALLRKLQADVMEHLAGVYGVTPESDKIKMYFHFPVAEKTATLHLHIWVNRADHPLNESRSFELNRIIDVLASGQTIGEMILARSEGTYYNPVVDKLRSIKGGRSDGLVDNPFRLEFTH